MPADGSITPIEFDFLWEAFSTGEAPYPLDLRSHGATVGERARLRRQTLQHMTNRGLIDADGAVHPLLGEQLELLSDASVSVDSLALFDPDEPARRALACANDDAAVLAVQDDESLTLESIEPDALVSAIAGLLPASTRGTARSMSAPVADGKIVAESERDKEAFAELSAQPRLRGGQFGASVRDEDGLRARSTVLSWFDTATGRYMVRASDGLDSTEWITVAPLDTAALRQHVAELIADARARVGRVTT